MDEISKETAAQTNEIKTGSSEGHHEHHHHEHHHHHHGDSAKKRKIKKIIKSLCVILAAVVVVAAVAVLAEEYLVPGGEEIKDPAENISDEENSEPEEEETNSIAKTAFCVALPLYVEDAVVTGEAAMSYYKAPSNVYVQNILLNYSPEERLDIGLSMGIKFDVKNIPEGYVLKSSRLELSDDQSFENPRTIELDENHSASIDYLKTGTEYFYRFVLIFADGEEAFFEGTFSTAEGPRVLSIDGIRNVRDIGGWKTVDGRTVRQGLLYRGTEMDASVVEEYKITEAGAESMISVLGIKTDMDLRWEGDVKIEGSALGEKVEYINHGAAAYMQIFEDYGKTLVKPVFSDLARREKYPIYMHCTYGADRTGTMVFLLELLLGVSEEDAIKEYELTGLTHSYFSRDLMTETLATLKTYEGETLQEKVENYLLSIGVTLDEISTIKSIFLE